MSAARLITLVQDTLARTVTLIEGTVQRCNDADETLKQAQAEVDAKHTHKEAAITKRLQRATEALNTQFARDMKNATTKWMSKSSSLNEHADERRETILDESVSIRTTAAEEAKEAKWLADSMYEANINNTEQSLERVTKHLEEAKWRQNAVQEQAAEWRKTLGMPEATAPEQQESPLSPESPSTEEVDRKLDHADACLEEVRGTTKHRFMQNVTQYTGLIVPTAIGIAIGFLTVHGAIAIPAGLSLGVCVFLLIRFNARRTRWGLISSAEQLAVEGVALADRRLHVAKFRHNRIEIESRQSRDTKHETTRASLAAKIELAGPRSQRRLEKLDAILQTALEEAQAIKDETESHAKAAKEAAATAAAEAAAHARQKNADETKQQLTCATETHAEAWTTAVESWTSTQEQIHADLETISTLQSNLAPHWPSWDANWATQELPVQFAGDIGIGRIRCTVEDLPSGLPSDPRLPWTAPAVLELPAAIDFQGRGSLVIEADEGSQAEGIAIMQAVIARALTTIPAGQLRLTLYDPIGLGQNFAGFMHLADNDEASILERTWTEPRHIESKLGDITEHMETVIQAYLRNEYDSLEAYNRAAGQIAEPYHLLVLANFPEGITDNAAKRLASILASGPRCGVFTCLLVDPNKDTPEPLQDLEWNESRVRLAKTEDGWRLTAPALGDFEFIADQPPADTILTQAVQRVADMASEAHRVEVPFELISPTEEQRWTRSSTDELRVTLGQSGANRFQEIKLGRGTTQHALVAGRTGSGKSTLLHVLITNMALWYSPDELEFHLIDFKKGVEFQTYAMHALPHARVVAIESDREFGLSVLRRLDEELRRRGDLFRGAGVQDVAGWRAKSDTPMPRVLLVVDEFQEFFADDDTLAQESGLLLDRLVRQGRAFGIHVLMGSQTLDGAFSLARSTLGQMGVRIALQCAEADSYLILSDENPAARLLRRPGEAIYNDAGGKIEGNSPFQVVWLDDHERDAALATVSKLEQSRFPGVDREQFIFKGNIPSLLHSDPMIEQMLDADAWPAPSPIDITLGDPIAIKPQTTLPLRARSGCNTLLVGQHPESGNAILTGALLQLAATLSPTQSPDEPGLMTWIFDGTPSDALFAGRLPAFGSQLPHQVTRVTAKNLEIEMQRLSDILASRADGDHTGRATILILGLHPHRLNALRSAEDDFSFSSEDEKPKPDKQFADILREGPVVGMHSLLWFDGLNNLNRCLSRSNQREFDLKVLFQMSANDSGQLIDTTAASDLGANRAIIHADDVGSIEKFRPWAMPNDQWLEMVATSLSNRRQ
ncbi:MAG: ATP-binding protein [Phycisphaerae bacterium]|nr:ATP-binding protein [Phycisphaerae bacterium]